MDAIKYFENMVRKALDSKFGSDAAGVNLSVDRTPGGQAGHFGTNAALGAARILKKNPLEIAEALAKLVAEDENIKSVSVARPGYLNWEIKASFFEKHMRMINEKSDYFKTESDSPKKVNIEFVSANPTGPLNVVSGRAAAYGDTLANLMETAGYIVTREFYVNDHGRQVRLFGESVLERYLELHGAKEAEIPEDGYAGDYVAKIAASYDSVPGGRNAEEVIKANSSGQRDMLIAEFAAYSVAYARKWQEQTLLKFGVRFDVWFSEETMYVKSGGRCEVEEALDKIEKAGLLYEKEGAIWFRTTDFGDDKDRVVKKAGGELTYFASDIAYLLNKVKRGAGLLINILGPDHHGYIKRLESIVAAFGFDRNMLQVLILQQVNLLECGEKMKMSKREGKIVTLDELIEFVGRDAARYYFIMRNYNSHLDFDMNLAREQSDKNPVYYVQYGYARACSILEHASEKGIDVKAKGPFSYDDPAEQELMLDMIGIPAVIREAAEKRSPSGLIKAIHGLVADFHSFYAKCRVLSDDITLTANRLFIVAAFKNTLKFCFDIIGITAREKM